MRTYAFALVMACLCSSLAQAELSFRMDEPRGDRQALASVPVPCLRDERDRRVVVTWWIENKTTGERRASGSSKVRVKC